MRRRMKKCLGLSLGVLALLFAVCLIWTPYVSAALVNPDFETGTSPWVFYTNGSGTFNRASSGNGTGMAGLVSISSPGTNVQLYQANVVLEPNTPYRLSFKAYSNTGHDVSVSLIKHGAPYTGYGLSNYSFNLTSSWNSFSVEFTTGGFTGTVSDGRLMFWLAPFDANGDQYFFDDVVLEKVGSSIVLNPDFEEGTSPWVFYTNGSGTFSNDAAGDLSAYAAHITINQQGTNVQLFQPDLTLEPNTVYALSFSAYSNTGHDASVSLIKHGSPYTNYGLSSQVFNLTTSWQTYSVQFTTSGFSGEVDDGRLMFWLAPFDANGDQYFFDDIALTKVSQGTATPTPPVIISHPASVTVTAGQAASFNVSASGTAPLSYQWQKNGVNISGATSASYTTPATTLTDNGATFRCIVSNLLGSATSNSATLTVTQQVSGPVITVHPVSKTVTVGQTATFSVTASGTAPLTYQWQKNGVNISGATSASYTTPATTLTDNGATFRCIVRNSLGGATSNAATLTVTSTSGNNQLLLIDRTFVHSTSYSAELLGEIPASGRPNCIYVPEVAYPYVCNHEAFKFFQMPSSSPSNWTSPLNYSQGTLYQRVQIISKPSTTPVRYAMCMFQDEVEAPRHACGDLSKIAFTGPGTYYSSQAMTTLYQYSSAINWTREPHVIMLHMTDNYNHQPDSYPGFMDLWYGTPNWSLYYPMTLRYTAIIVPPGGGAPVWP